MFKVSIWQHLLHSEEEFIKYLSNAGFKIPSDYNFENIWDDEYDLDGGRLIFEINQTDLSELIFHSEIDAEISKLKEKTKNSSKKLKDREDISAPEVPSGVIKKSLL